MAKTQLELAGAAIYGWCDRCQERKGRKLYRLLINGSCNDCNRKWGVLLRDREVSAQIGKSTKPPAPKKERSPRIFVPPSKNEFREEEEEEEFLKALQELQLFGSDWVASMAKHLKWSHEKTQKVGHRLKKRGVRVPLGSNATRLLQLIEQYPWSTAEELHSLMAVSFSHFEKLLRQAIKKSDLTVLDNPTPKLRRYRAAMDFLVYASRSDCICAYSQKFRCYGIFDATLRDRDPKVIAALTLKHPAIVSEKSDFKKFWIPAHSIIVGSGEEISATTDLLCGFPKGETPIQDCLNEVEGKRQLLLESEARKAIFAPGRF